MLSKLKDAFNGVVQQQKAKALARSNLQSYKQAVETMLGDLQVDQRKMTALQGHQRSFTLDPNDVSRIHGEVFSDFTQRILREDQITAQGLEALGNVGVALGLSWQHLPPHQLHAVQVIGTVIGIQQGKLPMLDASQCSINLQRGESVHAEMPCQLLDERVYHEHLSGSRGYSVRIAKGVRYRIGSTRGRTIPHTQIVPVDHGALSITSQRIVFVGSRQNFSTTWSKVLHAEPMADGVALALASRKKTILLKYQDHSYGEVIAALINHYIA